MLFTINVVLHVLNLLSNNKIVNNGFLDLLNTVDSYVELRLKSYIRILYQMFDILFVMY